MNLNYVFYFKNIVDKKYFNEEQITVNIKEVVIEVGEIIQQLSDEDFIEVMISCFIPDLYSGMGKKEKLFTKLTELMVGEWWRRMGGTYYLPTKKSGTEDVELIYENISIVCDVKVFRLGRSQKAPNVKDFLKLASVAAWIRNLKKDYQREEINQIIIGGFVTYSSLHEWESDSEVYEECTNCEVPVVMLPYEILALLLKYKKYIKLNKFIAMWNYSENGVETTREKVKYWNYITKFICDLLPISAEQYRMELKEYHKNILLAVKEYRKIVQEDIDKVKLSIAAEIDKIQSMERLKAYALKAIELRDNAISHDYLKHMDDFRYYRDQDK